MIFMFLGAKLFFERVCHSLTLFSIITDMFLCFIAYFLNFSVYLFIRWSVALFVIYSAPMDRLSLFSYIFVQLVMNILVGDDFFSHKIKLRKKISHRFQGSLVQY